MNYEVHLNKIFATPELAEEFMKAVLRQLNDITFDGVDKIDKVRGGVDNWLLPVIYVSVSVKEKL